MAQLRKRMINVFIPLCAGGLIPLTLHRILDRLVPQFQPSQWQWAGIPLMLIGLYLVGHAAYLVYCVADAPLWDALPPRLIVVGPYRYVRNPMALGMFLLLSGEAVLFTSTATGLWALVFLLLSHQLVVRVEEPSLRAAFGEAYDQYAATTPRWVPRGRCAG